MVPVLIPIAIAAATAGVGIGLGVVTAGAALLSVAATAVAAGASYLMRPNTGAASVGSVSADPIAAPINSQRAIPIAQPIPPRRFAYGPVRTGGSLFFQDNANPLLLIGTALSDGVIESVDATYLGENVIAVDGSGGAVAGTPFFGKFSVEWAPGSDIQSVSALLAAAFPVTVDTTFRQQGVARAVVQMNWGDDIEDNNTLWGGGISPSFLLKGVKVYDPRDGAQSPTDRGTWVYSANPALCTAHALISAWGTAIDQSFIDWSSVSDAADVCDTTLTYQDVTVPIFRLGGLFQGDVEFGSQLSDMLTSFRGRIVFSDGKYQLVADEARSSMWTVTDDDILELGEYAFATEGRSLFNAASAVYYDASQGGTRTSTEAYELSDAVTAEGLRETTVTLPFTPDAHSAQIIAYRELLQTRDGRAMTLRLTDAALYLKPSEVITIATTYAPWMNGDFEVTQIDLAEVGALVTLRGYNPDVYADPADYLI